MVIVLASHFCGLGSIPEPDVTCELSLSLVLVFALTAFLQVLRFYFLFRNQHFKFQFNLSETEKDKSHLVKCPLLNSHFYFVFFLFMSSIVGLRIFKINRVNTSTRDFGKTMKRQISDDWRSGVHSKFVISLKTVTEYHIKGKAFSYIEFLFNKQLC